MFHLDNNKQTAIENCAGMYTSTSTRVPCTIYRLTRPVCATAPMTSDWLACLRCMHMHRHIEGSTSSDCWAAARLCTRVVAAASYVHLMARRGVG
jgi:hypothetical protein